MKSEDDLTSALDPATLAALFNPTTMIPHTQPNMEPLSTLSDPSPQLDPKHTSLVNHPGLMYGSPRKRGHMDIPWQGQRLGASGMMNSAMANQANNTLTGPILPSMPGAQRVDSLTNTLLPPDLAGSLLHGGVANQRPDLAGTLMQSSMSNQTTDPLANSLIQSGLQSLSAQRNDSLGGSLLQANQNSLLQQGNPASLLQSTITNQTSLLQQAGANQTSLLQQTGPNQTPLLQPTVANQNSLLQANLANQLVDPVASSLLQSGIPSQIPDATASSLLQPGLPGSLIQPGMVGQYGAAPAAYPGLLTGDSTLTGPAGLMTHMGPIQGAQGIQLGSALPGIPHGSTLPPLPQQTLTHGSSLPQGSTLPLSQQTLTHGSGLPQNIQGSTLQSLPPGTNIQNIPQGSAIQNLAQGAGIPNLPQGSTIQSLPPGTNIQNIPQGSAIQNLAQGTTLQNIAQGSTLQSLAQGSNLQYGAPIPHGQNIGHSTGGLGTSMVQGSNLDVMSEFGEASTAAERLQQSLFNPWGNLFQDDGQN